MFGRVYAIAVNTFREAVRDRVLYGVVGFACLVLVFSLVLAELSLHEERRVVVDVGLASISFFSVVVATFLGSSLLYKEIERKTLYVILPKPIGRGEFLLGKFCGIVLTAKVFILIMGGVQLVVMAMQAGVATWTAGLSLAGAIAVGVILVMRASDRTAAIVPATLLFFVTGVVVATFARVNLVPPLIALALTAGEVALLTAVALFFSSFSTPFLTGAFTLGVWLVGRSADDMTEVRSEAVAQSVKAVLGFLAHVVPNFNLFVPGRYALETGLGGNGGALVYAGTTLGYGALYASVLLMLAGALFRRRDLV